MFPVYRDGDVLICQRRRGREIEAARQDCVVETADGRHLVKMVRKGTRPGLFTLQSYNRLYDDIENVSLAWAAPVRWIKRG
jgi:phage repressor protein C with HTH and peptisase S24 domain